MDSEGKVLLSELRWALGIGFCSSCFVFRCMRLLGLTHLHFRCCLGFMVAAKFRIILVGLRHGTKAGSVGAVM